MLMNPAFPDLVAEQAVCENSIGAHGRILRLVPPITDDLPVDEIVEILIVAAAEQDIAENRCW